MADSGPTPRIGTLVDGHSPAFAANQDTPTYFPASKGNAPELVSVLAPPQSAAELGRLGHFAILRVLGRGGMGLVLLANDTQLQRQVAIKVMLSSLAQHAESRERFLREARAVAKVKHDHIVTIFAVGEERNLPYIAMELLNGRSLEQHLESEHRVSVIAAIQICSQLGQGLGAAHTAGLIHRDIKPSNIWLEETSIDNPAAIHDSTSVFRVKILDFGLARDDQMSAKLTASGAILGTPMYMSPEQACGETADRRSDLFSLGVVLYRLCAGQQPFKGTSALAVLRALTTDIPKRLRELNPEIPPQLESLAERLLAKNPVDRPQTAEEVISSLAAIEKSMFGSSPTVDSDATSKPNLDSSTHQTQRQRGRRPIWMALAFAAPILALGGYFLFADKSDRSAPSSKGEHEIIAKGEIQEPADANSKVIPVKNLGREVPPTGGLDPRMISERARMVLKTHCHRCHNGEGSEGGNFDVLNDKTLVSAMGGNKPVVVAGQLPDSLLWHRAGVGKSMPPKSIEQRPTDEELTHLRTWIEIGAPPFPTEEAHRHFVAMHSVLTLIHEDLRAAAVADRPNLRYFSLVHLYNNPHVLDGDLAVYRAALSKALNSLSSGSAIVFPRAIDPQQTVFAINIRDLQWDRDNDWRMISVAYPYSLRYDGHRDPGIEKLDEDIRSLSKCNIPLVRADWFAAVATRPPLYDALLHIPKDARELEKRLKVDVIDNFQRFRLDRAGFIKSGVSEQNRMIERHQAVYGYYWKSYDFKKASDKGSLIRYPLGPFFDKHPYPEAAFRHDGGEIIFSLPNGLQGYMLINGKDERIEEGPIEVVNDSLKTSGTNIIVNGLSCMACHKHGMIDPPKDVVRDGAALFGDARRAVERLYVVDKRMTEIIDEDKDRFLRALDKATGPFLRMGPDKDKAIKEFPEPIGEISRLYVLQELDLAMAAYELGLENPLELKGKIQTSKKLREIGLIPLTLEGGALKRADWEKGVNSLMQRVARELELGSPNREVE